MDAFFASIEQAVNPRLKGKPLIVGSRDNRLYTVVCAASYEAKALGIDSGMPSKEAFNLCPDLEFVVADQSKYIWTSEQILEGLKAYGFEVVYVSIDEFQLDIGSYHDPLTLAQTIQKQIRETFNISASIGIARNCILAKLASKLEKPYGLVILTQENLEATLADTPVKRLCGIGSKTEGFLETLGIKTCLDLYQKSPQFLEQNLGQNGLNLFLSLHSNDHFDPIQGAQEVKSIGHSYTLPRASENTGFIKAWIRLLSEMIARRLREKKLAAKTVHFWLDGPDIGNFGAQKTYQEPTDNGYEVYLRSLKIMARIGQRSPKVRALGVTASSLFSVSDTSFLLKEDCRREVLIKAVDGINTRFGEWSVYPAVIALTRKTS